MTKVCVKCHVEKPLSEFYKAKRGAFGVRTDCKECNKDAARQWSALNPDKVKESQRRSRLKNRQKNKQCQRRWYEANKEKHIAVTREWAENNKDKTRKSSSDYRKRNKSRFAAYAAARKAREINATPKWVDLEIVQDFYLEAKYHGLVVDHIVPLQGKNVCGLHVEHNLQLLTTEENCKKSNKWLP